MLNIEFRYYTFAKPSIAEIIWLGVDMKTQFHLLKKELFYTLNINTYNIKNSKYDYMSLATKHLQICTKCYILRMLKSVN